MTMDLHEYSIDESIFHSILFSCCSFQNGNTKKKIELHDGFHMTNMHLICTYWLYCVCIVNSLEYDVWFDIE